jgi:glyoxylase-like metal-dependent hydrolase (beta-lactamase superfamily II)
MGGSAKVQHIQTISLALPLRLGRVNCYLVETDSGFVLLDTGPPNQGATLVEALLTAGCRPGAANLQLIVLTHGDFDHIGNAAYLRQRYGAKIAMHKDDAGMAERGDMFWNRSSGGALMRWLVPILFRFGETCRFRPDIYLEEGDTLVRYAFDAQVISVPGHSRGSIAILTAAGDLFCGDLFDNTKQPAMSAIMDDPATGEASLAKLERLGIHTVYPGHGQPFPMVSFLSSQGH